MALGFCLAGNTNSIFALDYISGALTLNGLLDRENPLYSHGFILTVKVRSPGQVPHLLDDCGHPEVIPGSSEDSPEGTGVVNAGLPGTSHTLQCLHQLEHLYPF